MHPSGPKDERSKVREKLRGEGTIYLPKGSSIYRGEYYVNGKRQTFSTRTRSEEKARKKLRQRVAEALSGGAPTEDARRLRYADLETGLLADYRMRERRSLKDMPRVLAPLRRAFGGWRALDITPVAIRTYKEERLEEGAKPATINKQLSALSRMRRLAVLDGRLPPQAPIQKLPTDNARRGFLDPADFEAFSLKLPDYLQPLARFAYLTGWRKGELLGLQWRQVDLKGSTIRLENDQTKTGKGRVLAFTSADALGALLHSLHARRRLDCPFVFHHNGRRLRDLYHAWRKAAESAGRPGLLLHDFRRSTARNLIRAGVPERVAMAVTGHRTRAIFDRYNVVNETDLRDASARVSAYLSQAESPQNRHSEATVVPIAEKQGT